MFIIPEFNPHIEKNNLNSSPSIVTYKGRIKSLQDALLVLEGTRLEILPTINRRLTSGERAKYIQDETIFVWNETKCGMKRWTDGKYWSASKVYHSHFLIYKQLIKVDQSKQVDYNGLIKQSFSLVTKQGDRLHLISYYKNHNKKNLMKKSESIYESDESNEDSDDDVSSNIPSQDPKLKDLVLSYDIYPQNFLNDIPKSSKSFKRSSSPQEINTTISSISSPSQSSSSMSVTPLPINPNPNPSLHPHPQSHPHPQPHLHSHPHPYLHPQLHPHSHPHASLPYLHSDGVQQPLLKKKALDLPPISSAHLNTPRPSYNYNDTCALNVLDKVFSI